MKRATDIFIFISAASAHHAKWTALECVLNANLVAKSAPVGQQRRFPGSLRTGWPALRCVVRPPQERTRTGGGDGRSGGGGGHSSPSCSPLILQQRWDGGAALERSGAEGVGRVGGWLLLGLSPVAKRTPYGQLAGVTGAPGQFPEFT